MRGRKATLTADMVDRFAEEVVHVSIASAGRVIGFSESKVHEWLADGRAHVAKIEAGEIALSDLDEQGQLCVRLAIETDRAISTSEGTLVRKIAAADDWRAWLALLERRHVEQWGRRRMEVTGADGGPLTVEQIDRMMKADDEHARSVEDADGGGSLD